MNEAIEPQVMEIDKSLVIDDEKSTQSIQDQKYISDDGTVKFDILPQEKQGYYKEIARSLNEKDLTSVASYGSDLQNAMNTYSSDF